jgi:hypothetical protein
MPVSLLALRSGTRDTENASASTAPQVSEPYDMDAAFTL